MHFRVNRRVGSLPGSSCIFINREAREIIRLVESIHPFVCLHSNIWTVSRSRSDVWHVVVNIWAQLAECSKSTMTHGIKSNISLCLSVIRKCSQSKAARSGGGLLIFNKSRCRKIPFMGEVLWIEWMEL